MIRGVFIGEGPSDRPLGDIVARLLRSHGMSIIMAAPDFDRLPASSGRDVHSKIKSAIALTNERIDLFAIHRDADNVGIGVRRREIENAVTECAPNAQFIPIIPIKMTEAWLLLDEQAIRLTAGNPRGRASLLLPTLPEVERRADPKALLAEALMAASGETGRRRQRFGGRFGEHRRRLLEQLDTSGPVTELQGWKALSEEVDRVLTEANW